MENFFKKYWWVLVLIIFILLLVIAWLLFMGKDDEEEKTTPAPTTTTSEATKSATPSSKKTKNTESDAQLLKKAVSEKTGIDIDIIIVEVSENTGKYAKGLVTAKGETVGGGYWLALKTDGKWAVVFDGQNTPECSLVDPPGFPADLVPECFDASGNLVIRN